MGEWRENGVIGVDLSMCSELAHEVKTKKQMEEELIGKGGSGSSKRIVT